MKKVTKKDPMFNHIKNFYKTGSGIVNLEVVSNLIFNHHLWDKKIDPKWLNFLHFLKQDPLASSLLSWHIYDILKHNFGRCDFKFTGNREYKNWIIEHNGVYCILSAKSEIILPTSKKESQEFYNSLITIQYELFNMALDFFKNNPAIYNDADGYISTHLKKLEKNKVIVNNKFHL